MCQQLSAELVMMNSASNGNKENVANNVNNNLQAREAGDGAAAAAPAVNDNAVRSASVDPLNNQSNNGSEELNNQVDYALLLE